jgi:hypothetical protein
MSELKFGVIDALTMNIGDAIQTLAAIHVLKKLAIFSYVILDRESLHNYDGEPLVVLMNGWYMHKIDNFPPSPKLTPIFISFHCADETLIKKNIDYFKKYSPIGCRDSSTLTKMKNNGIDAYFSGCMTLCFERDLGYRNGMTYLVDVDNNYPKQSSDIDRLLRKYFPFVNSFTVEKIEHNVNSRIITQDHQKRLEYAQSLLKKYSKARVIITTRLHCALPCRAFGTNVIFLHPHYKADQRFTGLQKIINGSDNIMSNYKKMSTIDYEDVEKIKKQIIEKVTGRIEEIKILSSTQNKEKNEQ